MIGRRSGVRGVKIACRLAVEWIRRTAGWSRGTRRGRLEQFQEVMISGFFIIASRGNVLT